MRFLTHEYVSTFTFLEDTGRVVIGVSKNGGLLMRSLVGVVIGVRKNGNL